MVIIIITFLGIDVYERSIGQIMYFYKIHTDRNI